MVKNILVVGAGQAQKKTIEMINNLGLISHSIDGDKKAPGLLISKFKAIGDIKDHLFIFNYIKKYKINAVMVVATDAPMLATAKACAKAKIPFMSPSTANLSTNKLKQRKLMIANGFLTPKFQAFSNLCGAKKAAKKIGFPSVVKPVDSSGSRAVKLLMNEEMLEKYANDAISTSGTKKAMIEEYISGTEYSIEGFVINKKIVISATSEKVRSAPPALLDVSVIFPDNLARSNQKKLINTAKNLIAHTKLNNCPFHIEAIYSSKGPVIVEFAARGPGFKVFTDILPEISGIDTLHTQLNIALNKPRIKYTKKLFKYAHITFIAGKNGIVKSIKGLSISRKYKNITEVEFFIKKGDKVKNLESGSDRIGYIIGKSNNLKNLRGSIKKTLNTIVVNYE